MKVEIKTQRLPNIGELEYKCTVIIDDCGIIFNSNGYEHGYDYDVEKNAIDLTLERVVKFMYQKPDDEFDLEDYTMESFAEKHNLKITKTSCPLKIVNTYLLTSKENKNAS